MIANWEELRKLALSLKLPQVADAISWGNPTLKAHGKLWCWWSPYIDAAIFKGSQDERELLMQADPATFVLHPHYKAHNLILVAGGKIDPDWAKARLTSTWRELAPKTFLKTWDQKDEDQ